MKLGPGISAVVVGGATMLGAATVQALISAGCKVAILDRRRETGEALAQRLGALYCHMEAANEVAIDAALGFAREANGVERVLVNFAGVAEHNPVGVPGPKPTAWRDESGRIFIHDVPSFERLLQANLTGAFYLAAKAAEAMMSLPLLEPGDERGVIINSASSSSEDGLGGEVAHAAAEGGVLALTRPMARDLAGEGIRVMTIMPGRILGMWAADGAASESETEAGAVAGSALVARKVIEICESQAMNGQVLRLEGVLRAAAQ